MTLMTEDDLSTPMTKFAGLTSLWTKSREWMNSIRSSWEPDKGARSTRPKKEMTLGWRRGSHTHQLVCDEEDGL